MAGPASNIAALNHLSTGGQEPGDGRRRAGDRPAIPGTSGEPLGLSGEERRALGGGWLCGLAIVGMIMAFDILTRSHDHPERGVLVPVIDELSSAMVTAIVFALPASMAIWMRRTTPPVWKAAVGHIGTALVYAVAHVSGFVALRRIGYAALLHCGYDFGPVFSEFLYEAAKDVPAYAFGATAFWLVLRWLASPGPPIDAAAPASLDIRDGARLVRALVAEILAVRSAGNYAEFFLADGRRPLMRTSLGALEARLAPLGFVRTHRSWLVNAARVTGLKPEGSGDYAVELGEVEAPLSRRFREALAILRP